MLASSPKTLCGVCIHLSYNLHISDLFITASDTETTSAALLLSKAQPLLGAQSACNDLGEGLWSPHLEDFSAGLNSSLAYEVYAGTSILLI